ncbi:complement C1q and tumor necrosis factor-related protein 9-like [Solea solea]|uniref:complement C1q and tumor necrosis factor-related protein 9-like n=1 Tax=Solea solea TaxID=90069 RepID=UPI00272C1B89|nr:complement C1q and tumor necrosis factor-related protein 9-like [Solea solea]
MMRRTSERAMSLRFVGLLVLSSLCSVVAGQGNDTDDDGDSLGSPNNFNRMLNGSTPVNDPRLQLSDTDMCNMLLWNLTPLPTSQIPFQCICSHCKGTIGPKGDHGDRGLPGMSGSPGSDGLRGFRGPRGFSGLQGIKGQKGDIGEKGETGWSGVMGYKGAQGFKGEKGDFGLMGPPGTPGLQGETGSCPDTCDSAPGPPGPQGPPGSAGARGLPGLAGDIGPKGFKGDKGDLGDPGHPGLDGPKGDMGEQGLCECSDGINGKDGGPGPKGDKGAKGDIGIQGVRGSTGTKGDEGQMGLMGPIGPCSPAIQSAFSASTNDSFPIPNWPIPFTHVHINQQLHFNPNMGLFTAPVDGIYVFSYHLAVVGKLKVGLFHNFNFVVTTTEETSHSTASQSVILHLKAGDWVWLQVKNSNTNGLYADSESSSTFSGYLLYPDSCMPMLGRDSTSPLDPNRPFTWGNTNTTTTPSP